MATRRDYEMVSSTIDHLKAMATINHYHLDTLKAVAYSLANRYEFDNKAFDRDRFLP